MSFICPDCEEPTLEITDLIELGPDGRSDEVTFQIIECNSCGFRGIAVYEESRRGGSDISNHFGFEADDVHVDNLARLIGECPDPLDDKCQCDPHQLLRQKDGIQSWELPVGTRDVERFEMEIQHRTNE